MLLRLIPLPIHGALELAAGVVVGLAPLALGLGDPAIVAGATLGLIMIGLAAGAAVSDGYGPARFSVAAHAASDWALALGLLASGAVAAIADAGQELLFFAAAGTAQIALIATTRYTASR